MKLNLKEAEELLKTYKSISYFTILKEYLKQCIYRGQVRGMHVMNRLTGFGYISNCKLCQSAFKIFSKYSCLSCIYSFCPTTCQDVTYNNLSNAKTPFQIWKALQKRINYLSEVITNLPKYIPITPSQLKRQIYSKPIPTHLREGQFVFNQAYALYPAISNYIKSINKIDCYYDDKQIDLFLLYLLKYLNNMK